MDRILRRFQPPAAAPANLTGGREFGETNFNPLLTSPDLRGRKKRKCLHFLFSPKVWRGRKKSKVGIGSSLSPRERVRMRGDSGTFCDCIKVWGRYRGGCFHYRSELGRRKVGLAARVRKHRRGKVTRSSWAGVSPARQKSGFLSSSFFSPCYDFTRNRLEILDLGSFFETRRTGISLASIGKRGVSWL